MEKTSNEQKIIEETVEYVKDKYNKLGPSHDFWHVYRVWKNSINISKSENVNLFIVEMAALLHDLYDSKYFNGTLEDATNLLVKYLNSKGVEDKISDKIIDIINNMSYSKNSSVNSLEQAVVSDADRLDAIGAIGIARCFTYSGEKNRTLHIPGVLGGKSREEYKKLGSETAIAHFNDKLLKIKDSMLTNSGKKIAKKRHDYLQEFYNQFLAEWDGLK